MRRGASWCGLLQQNALALRRENVGYVFRDEVGLGLVIKKVELINVSAGQKVMVETSIAVND